MVTQYCGKVRKTSWKMAMNQHVMFVRFPELQCIGIKYKRLKRCLALRVLTFVLLNGYNCTFRHLELDLQTQFSAPNDENIYIDENIDISNIKLLDLPSIYQ